MEGYSVTEAASVLGVPTERVWELLARGVLSGAPEGETGMRVFLQPRPAPAPVEDPRRGNGHDAQRDRDAEASPFRELLTEFRNLTERYGQALLALGEARGEVASLRSRVDVLEARMDLRLPMSTWGAPQAASVQPPPAEPDQRAEPAPGADEGRAAAAEAEASGEHEQPARRRRGRAQRRATDDFAEALARADDPSPAVLRGAAEAAAARAALRDEGRGGRVAAPPPEADLADATLPRELPFAEPMAVAEPELAAPSELEPLMDTGAEATEMSAAEGEAEPESAAGLAVEAEPEAMSTIEPEPEPVMEVEAEALEPADALHLEPGAPAEFLRTFEAAPEPMAEPETAPELEPMAEPATTPEPEPMADVEVAELEPVEAAEPASAPEPELAGKPVEAELPVEPVWDPERYTTQIEEPDWWTPEEEAWPRAAIAPTDGEASAPHASIEVEQSSPELEEPREATHGSAQSAELPDVEDSAADTGDVDAGAANRAAEIAAPVATEPELSWDDDAYLGEETMLWYGQRPEPASSASATPKVGEDAAASEDAAAEMEVASTGRHVLPAPQPVNPAESTPGSQHVDQALDALDALARRRPTPAPITYRTPAAPTVPAAETPLKTPRPTSSVPAAATPDATSPASRAYQRLRRIFPG